ncbi:hypothetical protein CP061683_1644 [Chlamydia psittaci 06-1683]|nr:hypothetical protein CP061683_1644 [Chlamydia psittaci 06-1683]
MINGSVSGWRPAMSGVPEGWVLGHRGPGMCREKGNKAGEGSGAQIL